MMLADLWRYEDIQLVSDRDWPVSVCLDLAIILSAVLWLQVGDDQVGALQPQSLVSPHHHGAGSQHTGTLQISQSLTGYFNMKLNV